MKKEYTELTSQYRPMMGGVEGFRKQNPHYGGPGSLREAVPESLRSRGPRYPLQDMTTGPTLGQRTNRAVQRIGQEARSRPQFPMSPLKADRLTQMGSKVKEAILPALAPSPRSVAEMKAFFSRPNQPPVNPANEPVPPFDMGRVLGPAQNLIKKVGSMFGGRGGAENQAVRVQGPFPTRPAQPEGVAKTTAEPPTSPAVRERAARSQGGEWTEGTYMNWLTGQGLEFPEPTSGHKYTRVPEGREALITKPGRYQLPAYNPNGTEKAMPVHLLRGNQASWWSPKTGGEFPTMEEALRGEPAKLTQERAAKAAERLFELEKIQAKGKAEGKWHYEEPEQMLGTDGESANRRPGFMWNERTGPGSIQEIGQIGGPQNPENLVSRAAKASTRAEIESVLAAASNLPKEQRKAILKALER
jgi:hypothetical protein